MTVSTMFVDMSLCIHDVCIVHLYVFIHVCMLMYVFMPMCILFCVKQCFKAVSETYRLLLENYLFVFVLFMHKHITVLNCTVVLLRLNKAVNLEPFTSVQS